MKKLMAILLMLCLLGSMGMAAAEEKKQTVSTALAEFDLPENAMYGVTYQQGSEAGILVDLGDLRMDIHLDVSGAQGKSQQAAFDEQFSYHVSNQQLISCQFTDWGLSDGEAVLGAASDTYGVYTHNYQWAVMDIRVEGEKFDAAAAANAVKPIFASLRKPAGNVPQAVYSNSLITVKLSQPATVSCAEDVLMLAENGEYQVMLVSLPYASEADYVYVEDLTVSSFQYNNLAALLQAAYGRSDADLLLGKLTNLKEEDIGMPNGQIVVHGFFDEENKMAVCAQQYHGVGYVIVVSSITRSGEEAMAFADQVAKELRFNMVSDELLAENAKKIIAEREEAAKLGRRIVKITNAGGANIRSGPGAQYDRIQFAQKNETFTLLGERNNWYRIDVDGQVGYIATGVCRVQQAKK